jgi:glutaryl-CoA dehydrogenase (non-decarboxylating)
MPLAPAHAALEAEVRDFVTRCVAPIADEMHRTQRTPPAVIAQLAERGYLGAAVPTAYGGRGLDAISLGLVAGEIAAGCSSLRSLLTVHWMVSHTIARWGSRAQKDSFLPRLASGACIAAFALSEPDAGSDAASITTRIAPDGDGDGADLVVTGHKSWITYGQIAQLYLVFGVSAAGPTAVLVDRETAGLSTAPIPDLLGLRASMTASLRFDHCRVAADRVIGRPGLGIAQIAASALDGGRYTVAWGSVGILRACLEASVAYATRRQQFGALIKDHQLIRQMITAMQTDWRAAGLLCLEAGALRQTGAPDALAATAIAKYFASTAAVRAASAAIQIHGANGCSGDYPLQRYLGDAKVMEIIEGSTQIQELVIANYAYQDHGHAAAHVATAAWRSS